MTMHVDDVVGRWKSFGALCQLSQAVVAVSGVRRGGFQ